MPDSGDGPVGDAARKVLPAVSQSSSPRRQKVPPLSPQKATPVSPDSPASARNHAAWAEQARSQLDSARSLREHALTHLRSFDVANWGSPVRRPQTVSYEVLAAQDRLKRRTVTAEGLAAALAVHMADIDNVISKVSRQIRAMKHLSGTMKAALGVVEKRIELRGKRPSEESIFDSFQEALDKERAVIIGAREQLSLRVQTGKKVLTPLEEGRDEMIRTQNTFHLDNTDHPNKFLSWMRKSEIRAADFCRESSLAMRPLERDVQLANESTVAQMKVRIRELFGARMRLFSEMDNCRTAIVALDHSQEKIHKELRQYGMSLESEVADDGKEKPGDSQQQQNELLSPQVVENLRAKIKAASYTGREGRDLAKVFGRFDLDGSGELEEAEFKRAMRRTLKIAPNIISDAQISLLFAMLDGNQSGTVNVAEIVAFLSIDDSRFMLLRERAQTAEKFKSELQNNLEQLHAQHQSKSIAWGIDHGCIHITTAQAFALDQSPRPTNSKSCALTSPRKHRGVPSLGKEAQEKIRSGMKSAACVASVNSSAPTARLRQMFARFDKDASGQLTVHEVRQAVRRNLKISAKAITDTQISSLCAVLDTNNSGTVSIDELMDFLGEVEEASTATASTLQTKAANIEEAHGQAGNAVKLVNYAAAGRETLPDLPDITRETYSSDDEGGSANDA